MGKFEFRENGYMLTEYQNKHSLGFTFCEKTEGTTEYNIYSRSMNRETCKKLYNTLGKFLKRTKER